MSEDGPDTVSAALERLERQGDPPLVRALLTSFLAVTPGRLEGALAARASGDDGELRRLVHMLRSSSLNLGATAMAAPCAEAEELVLAGRAEETDPLLEAIRARFDELRPRLERELSERET